MRQIYTLILLAAMPLLASCTQDEWQDSGSGIVPPGNSLHISSAILTSGGHTETEAVTRAVGDVPVPVTKGSLGIFRSKGTGYTSTLYNKKYTYIDADKGWQPATAADTLFLNGNNADVCAYYPYNVDAAYSEKTRIPLFSGKYTGTDARHDPNDICYDMNRTLNAAKRSTTFEMVHAMAMLELKITKDTDYKGDCRITSVSIVNPELLTSSDIDISTGTYATAPTKGTVAYNPGADADGILIGNTATVTAVLLVPFTPTADGLKIAFAVNGVPIEALVENDKMPKVEAGRRYTVNIKMKATSMQVTSVDMIPWEESGVGGNDYVWYPAGEGPPEHSINLESLDFYVADGNVVATEQADHSYKYAFAEGQGYFSGTALGGDYFNWNTPDPKNYTNENLSAWDPANDICSKIGDGKWYTPTKDQLQKLLDQDNVYGTYQMKNGGTKVKGKYFGTDVAPTIPDEQDTYVFIPFANQRLAGFSTMDPSVEVQGYLWSSTFDGTSNAWYLKVDQWSGGTNMGSLPHNNGFSVRCVRNK